MVFVGALTFLSAPKNRVSPQDSSSTEAKKNSYQDTEPLREGLLGLEGQKFRLDCGHHVTFGCFLGNDLTILNGKVLKIICSLCGY